MLGTGVGGGVHSVQCCRHPGTDRLDWAPPFVAPAGSPRDRPSLSQLWVTRTSVTQPREAGGGGYKTRLSGVCGVGPHPPRAISFPLTRPALGRGHSRPGSSGLPPLERLRAGLWALPWGWGGERGTPQLMEEAGGVTAAIGHRPVAPRVPSGWTVKMNQEK